ncbi:hydrolase [Gordonia spumicola]|uniref:Hydrolase n=1 Tax=Gordonia spumicola TaxID=589161 RepID=A0A7I9V878_9ACTN|nr:alpha/beta hydrolase [Gordonia spumicola]GEE01293.1 hydrolase [Gordonia spumicola]
MVHVNWGRLGKAAIVGGGLAAGAVAAELGLIGGLILREALKYPAPVQDGPDPLVRVPAKAPRSSVVGTPDGALLHVATMGDVDAADEVIVLIHGWTCNTSFWNPQFNHFADSGRAVIAYDQRGHGLSEMGAIRPTMDLLGQDLQAVLEEMVPDGKRAVLIGHSMGGMTIMSWAAQFSAGMEEKISAIVLTSTAAEDVVQRQQLVPELPAALRPAEPLVEKAFVSSPVPLPATGLSEKISHYVALGPVARQAHVAFSHEQIAACSPKARGAWGSAMYTLDVVAGLERISVPTAVVVGTKDRLTGTDHAGEIAAVLRGNGVLHSYTEYPGAGHMVPIERAAAYNRLLDTVLGDVSEAVNS